ncbi:MAG: hypothetical protein ACYCU7_05835 [Acidimicrobiales bacterium]
MADGTTNDVRSTRARRPVATATPVSRRDAIKAPTTGAPLG